MVYAQLQVLTSAKKRLRSKFICPWREGNLRVTRKVVSLPITECHIQNPFVWRYAKHI